MSLSSNYKTIIDNAVKAVHERSFFAQYPEHPKSSVYAEDSLSKGLQLYQDMLNNQYKGLQQEGATEFVGEEVSPYSQEALNIKYPYFSADELVTRSGKAFREWSKVPVTERANVLVDALERIKEYFFVIANATMHTTGQSWIMSFQASGPHSNDRALEALALGYDELTRFPQEVLWEKPMGKFSVKLDKVFKPIPKGISLAIGCSTFPVWNTVPGVFASLVTGNSVIVKPHPRSVLPIAIVVEEIQRALKEAGHDPQTIQLAADSSEQLITKDLAEHPDVKLIDYTGGSVFGNYIESLGGKTTFTEKAGVNSVILDSTVNIDDTLQDLAFAASLYSGQMCTAPQNFFIPEGGVKSGEEIVSFDEVVNKLKESVSGFAGHPKMGAGTLGAIQSKATLERLEASKEMGGKVVLESAPVNNPEYSMASACSPTIIEVEASDMNIYGKELFGPIILVIKTRNTDESIRLARDLAEQQGAITCAAYTTDDQKAKKIQSEMESVFVPVTLNLSGPIWVNQHAAFSDFHVTGGNPAGNASFSNPEYINKRFVWVGHRKLIS